MSDCVKCAGCAAKREYRIAIEDLRRVHDARVPRPFRSILWPAMKMIFSGAFIAGLSAGVNVLTVTPSTLTEEQRARFNEAIAATLKASQQDE